MNIFIIIGLALLVGMMALKIDSLNDRNKAPECNQAVHQMKVDIRPYYS